MTRNKRSHDALVDNSFSRLEGVKKEGGRIKMNRKQPFINLKHTINVYIHINQTKHTYTTPSRYFLVYLFDIFKNFHLFLKFFFIFEN